MLYGYRRGVAAMAGVDVVIGVLSKDDSLSLIPNTITFKVRHSTSNVTLIYL